MCKKNTFILLLIAILFIVGCDDNIDDDNPLIGKWRSEQYAGVVETNDSAATSIIIKDIESINRKKHPICQYEFMKDSLFVLYNINNDAKTVGNYGKLNDTIKFYYPDASIYWAIVRDNKNFNLYHEDVSRYYTLDSLQKLGIENPQNISIKKAWLILKYKRI